MNIPMILTLIVMAAVCAVACRLYYGKGVAHGYEFGRYNERPDKPHGWEERTARARLILEGDPFMWPELQAVTSLSAGTPEAGWVAHSDGRFESWAQPTIASEHLVPAAPPPAGGHPAPGGGYTFDSPPNSVLHVPAHKQSSCGANSYAMAEPSVGQQPEREMIGLPVMRDTDLMRRAGVTWRKPPILNDERVMEGSWDHWLPDVPMKAAGPDAGINETTEPSEIDVERSFILPEAEVHRMVRDAQQAADRFCGTAPTEATELPDAIRVPLDSLDADAGYLVGRMACGSMTPDDVVSVIRKRCAAIRQGYGSAMAQPSERPQAAGSPFRSSDITMGLAEYVESTKPAMVKVGDGYLGTFGELKLCQVSPAGDGSFALYANPEHVRPRAMETRPADSNNARARESHSLSDGSANVNSVGVVGGACISGNARWDQLHAASGYGMAQPSELSVEKALACEHLGTKACPTPHNCMRRGACIDKWDDLGPAASTDAARANAGY